MSKDEEIVICSKAIRRFGEYQQIEMAIEEMSELIQALSKYKRGKQHNVEEEIADVSIMLTQLKIMFDLKEIENQREFKLKRLEGTVKDERLP